MIQGEGLRQEYGKALQRVAEGYAVQSAWEKAISYARRWVAIDRLNEAAQRLLMFLYGQADQRSAGLRQYDELARLLQDELGEKPDAETVALYHKMREEPVTVERNRIEGLPGQPAITQPSEPLLKTKLYLPSSRGRKVFRRRLVHALNQIEQYPLLILSAPAGFGKTTTLVECLPNCAACCLVFS